ncbi:hypothetical protein AD006_32605 (plasmid) [Pseudonocardia sp. EC080610-09]|uniref:hypothetical protein n=1 Tax=Pseudonocardia sp. EC080610-09 TaxID=1688404 RepID=UPI0007064AF5|nr:hypothetical protein [Pseudonocardia sp. EC080610-09]ALL79959.1 hypothetical protein AD006_32605 [Pseudonocardia sp. EC080610-09]
MSETDTVDTADAAAPDQAPAELHRRVSAAEPGPSEDGESEVDRPRAGWPSVPDRRERVLRAATTAAAELRFVREQPASLHSGLALARQGAWTTTQNGLLRSAAVVHFWCIQAPVLIVGALIAWSGRTAGRVWTVVPLLLSVATALDQIPVVGLLVPEFLTWPYWPPFCWIN